MVICYDLFIDRIEDAVVGYLGLPHDYIKYKEILVQRYSSINKGLLTTKSKSFLDRVLAPSDNKREFYEKIGLVVFDRKIESLEDAIKCCLKSSKSFNSRKFSLSDVGK